MLESEDQAIEQEQQSDATQDSSSESQPESQPAQQAAAPEQKPVPFNEDPKIQDYIERQLRKHAEPYEARLAEMQRQLRDASRPKESKPDFNEVRTKMAERLKSIDPEFQSYMSLLEEQALSAKQELQSFREQQFVDRAITRVNDLNKSNGVSPEIAALYEAALDKEYRSGKIRSMEDLDRAYKAIHEPFSKTLADREKAALDKYVAEKKTAAAKPSGQPKGRAAGQAPGNKTYANDQQRRAAIVKEVVANMHAERDLG